MNKKKSSSQIKKDTISLVLPAFKGINVTNNEALILRKLINNQYFKYTPAGRNPESFQEFQTFYDNQARSFPLENKFFYSPALEVLNKDNFNGLTQQQFNAGKDNLLKYINQLKQKIRYAFDMPRKEAYLQDIISTIDQPVGEYKIELPRFKKLQRLKQFNELTVQIFLTILHEMYWVEFAGLKENVKNLNHYVAKVVPIVQYLYNIFLEQVEEEYPIDEYEESMKFF